MVFPLLPSPYGGGYLKRLVSLGRRFSK